MNSNEKKQVEIVNSLQSEMRRMNDEFKQRCIDSEHFETPEWAIQQILKIEMMTHMVIDPCAGNGISGCVGKAGSPRPEGALPAIAGLLEDMAEQVSELENLVGSLDRIA